MQLNGATILLTGATGAVGSGLAPCFAKFGATVLLCGRDEGKLAELEKKLPAGSRRYVYTADLCSPESLERLVSKIEADGHAIDVLINNAADPTSKSLANTSLDEIERIIRTNVVGALQLTRLVVPGMVARGRGVIVNMSSLAGYKPDSSQTVYSVSKGGLNAMSEALRAEFQSSGIDILNVALMGIGVGPRKVSVEELADRLKRAIEQGDSELFLYRHTKWLMRLYAACPWLMRKMYARGDHA